MKEHYTKLLTELKPWLGQHYQARIRKELGIQEDWTVKDAFRGKLGNIELLIKIYNKAFEIAQLNQQTMVSSEKKHRMLVKKVAGSFAIFLFLLVYKWV